MDDSFAVHRFLDERQPKSAAIVGAGYIGLEMADALTHRGIKVTVASRRRAFLRRSIRRSDGATRLREDPPQERSSELCAD
jgi:pyruvate/2-oxoglutarate dehydrogenase complex dihydrolipoamide dehydrogenase (E3) component